MCGEGRYGKPISSAQFSCEPKTALKNKVYFVKKAEKEEVGLSLLA